ncbi:aminopeptidase N-like [Palaemon carinicauda]|uniref:aminopeptidase N-like n=1 Tax=Palaemon carinicauda TaxID=392227 RepID=UPI0035B57112
MDSKSDHLLITLLWLVLISLVAVVEGSPSTSLFPGSLKSPRNLLRLTSREERHGAPANPKNIPTPEKDEYRLPTSLKPISYEVWLQPFIHGNFSIVGHINIVFEAIEATSSFQLHIDNITTFDTTVKITLSEGGPDISTKITIVDYDHQFYYVLLKEELEPGRTYNFSLDFESYLDTDGTGFFRSSYIDEEGQEIPVALTQFEANGARRAFPCFDEPSFKATFECHIAREESMSALSNMPLVETSPVEGQEGWLWDHFRTTPSMSTYLVAFVVSDFASNVTETAEGLPYTAWCRNQEIKHSNYALDMGPKVLTFYAEYLRVPYLMPKMDIAAVVGFDGAMENWGMIIYEEDFMLFDPEVQTEADKQQVTKVISHETSHQWFGDLVTMGWWSHLWLNEGFAKYMEYLGANHVHPEWNMLDQFVVDVVQYALEVDSDETYSHPVIQNVSSTEDISTIIDDITYKKGGSLNRMMNHILTEQTFVEGINSYLMEYQYNNAYQDYLFEHLTIAGHEDGNLPQDMTMKQVMDSWTLQAGYPVVTVNRSEDGTSAIVSQKRFLFSNESTEEETWWVPLTYTSQDNPDFHHTQTMIWMSDEEREITIGSLPQKDQWVVFNIQETGFYRVNYDDNNWDLLLQQLQTDPEAIHHLNRAQILDDYAHLSRAGYLSYSSAMDFFAYLRKEREYLPWASALNHLDYMELMLSETVASEPFKKFLLDLIVPLYEEFGFEVKDNMDQQEQFKQMLAIAWACDLGHEDCIENAGRLFNDWMESPDEVNSFISPNIRATVYCSAIAEGTVNEWNFAWNQYLRSSSQSEKHRILEALGCSRDAEILLKYLNLAFAENSDIKKDDALKVYTSVAKRPAGRELAWQFLTNNIQRIIYLFESWTPLAEMSVAVSDSFNSEEQKSQLISLAKNISEDLDEYASLLIGLSKQKVAENIACRENNYDVILHWLQEHNYAPSLRNI